jgi:hypothetical protein
MDRIIDFDAQIEDGGIIRIPEAMKQSVTNGNHVHVTIETEPFHAKQEKRTAKRMRENPILPPDFKPLAREEIYDRNL